MSLTVSPCTTDADSAASASLVEVADSTSAAVLVSGSTWAAPACGTAEVDAAASSELEPRAALLSWADSKAVLKS